MVSGDKAARSCHSRPLFLFWKKRRGKGGEEIGRREEERGKWGRKVREGGGVRERGREGEREEEQEEKRGRGRGEEEGGDEEEGRKYMYTHTHTHTHVYMYVYIYIVQGREDQAACIAPIPKKIER